MGYVVGHWRENGWVRGHFRHPHRPGLDQTVLVFLVASPVRIDLDRYGGPAASSRRPGVAVPAPRRPPEDGAAPPRPETARRARAPGGPGPDP